MGQIGEGTRGAFIGALRGMARLVMGAGGIGYAILPRSLTQNSIPFQERFGLD